MKNLQVFSLAQTGWLLEVTLSSLVVSRCQGNSPSEQPRQVLVEIKQQHFNETDQTQPKIVFSLERFRALLCSRDGGQLTKAVQLTKVVLRSQAFIMVDRLNNIPYIDMKQTSCVQNM